MTIFPQELAEDLKKIKLELDGLLEEVINGMEMTNAKFEYGKR